MSPALAEYDVRLEERSSPWLDAWRRFRRNRAAVASGWIVAVIVLASLIGPLLVRLYNGFEYDTLGLDNRLANPTLLHPFGTDTLGRDLLARVLYGCRISLMVMRAVDIFYALPDILLVVILMALFDRSLWLLFLALGATSWLTTARIVRGQVLSLKHEPFVDAARCAGVSDRGIILRHNAEGLKFGQRKHELLDRTGETIEPPDQHYVEFTSPRVLNEFAQPGAVLLRPAHPV